MQLVFLWNGCEKTFYGIRMQQVNLNTVSPSITNLVYNDHMVQLLKEAVEGCWKSTCQVNPITHLNFRWEMSKYLQKNSLPQNQGRVTPSSNNFLLIKCLTFSTQQLRLPWQPLIFGVENFSEMKRWQPFIFYQTLSKAGVNVHVWCIPGQPFWNHWSFSIFLSTAIPNIFYSKILTNCTCLFFCSNNFFDESS